MHKVTIESSFHFSPTKSSPPKSQSKFSKFTISTYPLSDSAGYPLWNTLAEIVFTPMDSIGRGRANVLISTVNSGRKSNADRDIYVLKLYNFSYNRINPEHHGLRLEASNKVAM